MPDWTFLVVRFVHVLALALWIGGAVVILLAAEPVIRAGSSPSQSAAQLAAIQSRFDRMVAACIVALFVTSAILIFRYGRLSPWYAIEYVCIGMMSASAIFSAAVIGPRSKRLRAAGVLDDAQLGDLARTAELAHQFNLACAAVALFFS